MYLKQIELENFKSFGTKVRIPFLTGFTAITGPNGSGKSNIIDAILFVLGVRSPKMVRAERLSDLIYKGDREAKYCKVSLIFDNSSNEIPVNSDEIVLTRKIKLAPLPNNPMNYYSYFYINGKSASLNEFVELLSSANISSSSIVQQGDVTAIVEMGDVQRRKIIDEIAGISEFDKEIDKAKREREEVEKNIEHIEIILGEIKRQIRQLKKERDEAVKYKQLIEELEKKKAMMDFKKKIEIEREISEIHRQIEKYEREKSENEEEVKKVREEYKEKQIRFQEIDNKLAEIGGEEIIEIKNKIDYFKEETIKAKEKINYYRKELAEEKGRINEAEAILKKIDKEVKQYKSKRESLENDLNRKRKEIEKSEKELNKIKEEIERADERSIEIGRKIAKIKKDLEKAKEDLHSLLLNKDRILEKREELLSKLKEIESNKNAFETELKEIKWEMSQVSREEKEIKKKKEKLERELFENKKEEANLSERLRECEKQMISLQRELSQLRAREDVASLSPATKEILRLRDEGTMKGIHGILAELGRAEEKYQKALEVSAGKRLEAVVVENDEIASKCIDYLKKNGYGRATFLPLNKLTAGKPRGRALLTVRDDRAIAFAIDLIKFDSKYKEAFWYAFGDTIVVKDLDSARSLMGGVRLVTLDGELVEASGAITGGSFVERKLFGAGDSRKIIEISEKIRELSSEQENISKRLIEIKDAIGKIEEELRSLPSIDFEKIEKFEIRKREIENKLKAVNQELERRSSACQEIEKFLEEIESKIGEKENLIKNLEREIEKEEKELLRIAKKEAIKEMEFLKEKIDETRKEEIFLDGKIKTLEKEYEIVLARYKEIESKIIESRNKVDEIEEDLREEEKSYEESKNELKTYEEIERKLLSKTKGLTEERDKLYREIVELENRIDKISVKIESSIDIISRAKARLPSLESALADLIDLKYEFKEEELLSYDEIKKRIKEIEENLQRIEPVNMRALEEYERQEERRKRFEEDLNKLKEQRKNLIKLEREIEKRKKDTFYKVFNEINKNFREIYRELADGDGELVLENEENPFEGGLLIKVKPGDKRMLHLNALSGGEKSIASLAFIFALQAYEPSPFYVLDEIDMFLDEKNAERVAKIISQRASTAQFIVVSLRRITLKHAHHIYGVTMSNGVSVMIGNVNLKEVEEMVEIK